MWLALLLLAFMPGEVRYDDGIYCDNLVAADLYLEAYQLTGDMSSGMDAVNTPEHPKVCGNVKDQPTVYVGEVKERVVRQYKFTIHQVWMKNFNVMQFVFTRVKLESS